VNSNQEIEIIISEDNTFAKTLHLELATAVVHLKNLMNNMDAVRENQPEPATEWDGVLDLNNRAEPKHQYIIAYGTDSESYPAILFKLGASTDDQEIPHLMAKFPVRVVVRIRAAMLNKGWKPGDSTAAIDSSTVSVWVYDKAAHQAKRVQGPENLSTPGGHIGLWGSDLLSVEDTTLPEEYQRPYKQQ
jgi:hypothetical protein